MDVLATFLVRHTISVWGLALLPTYFLRVATCAVALALDARVYYALCNWSRQDLVVYILACIVAGSAILTVYIMVVTVNPHETFRFHDSSPPRTAFEKCWWSTRVYLSPRLIGTDSQVPGIPKLPSVTPQEFVRARALQLLQGTIICVAAWLPVIWFDLSWFIIPEEGRLPILWQEVVRRMCSALLCLYNGCWGINACYDVISILCVATGLSAPKDCPPLFGPFFSGPTLAKCWNYVWHQSFRNSFGSFGDVVAHAAGTPPRSRTWWCLKISTAFIASGVMHGAGDYAITQGRKWFSPQFFWLQPLALMAEAGVISVADTWAFRRKYPLFSTIIGYAWVLTWFSLTFPAFTDYFLRDLLPKIQIWAMGLRTETAVKFQDVYKTLGKSF